MVSNKTRASRAWIDSNGPIDICCSLVVGMLVSCSDSTPDRNPPIPSQDDPLALSEAVDSNPNPHVFETTLDARVVDIELIPGTKTPVWTYNGLLPGPLIRVARGDRLIVHFTNSLPEPTSIHWHGLRISNAMDGVPDVTQPATQPGGAFTYDFVVPDEGIYWYHPHFDSAAQVGYGLYGALIVTDPDEPANLGEEHVLVLSDIALNADGSLMDPLSGGDVATLFGREGGTLLVNGKVNTVMKTSAGKRLRWRVINAAKTRYFQVGLDGQSFTRIGGDAGFIASPETTDRILLTPAQRADIVFDVALAPSSEAPVRWVPYDRGFGTVEFRSPETLLTLATDAAPRVTPPPLPALHRTIAPLDLETAKLEYLSLTENDQNGRIVLGINGIPGSQAAPLVAAIGETHVWVVQNTLDWAHPFHLHGFFFQVLSVNGVVPDVLEWRDTADVPVQGTTTLAVKFDERPGMWMFHCHILDHADGGMMNMVDLHE